MFGSSDCRAKAVEGRLKCFLRSGCVWGSVETVVVKVKDYRICLEVVFGKVKRVFNKMIKEIQNALVFRIDV